MNDLLRILSPAIVLACGALLILLLGAVRSGGFGRHFGGVSLATVVAGLLVSYIYQGGICCKAASLVSFDGAVRLGPTSVLATHIALGVGLVLILISWRPDSAALRAARGGVAGGSIAGEYFSMLLLSLAGLLLVFVANNFIVLFLALELVSLPTYVLVNLSRPVSQAKEASLKYFFLGALAAALLAYGFSFLYGATGTIRLDQFGPILADQLAGPLLIGLLLVFVALCFKIAAVPMHFYAADVYQGAASPVTALLAFVPKFAGFYALIVILRLFDWPSNQDVYAHVFGWLIWLVAALTITAGNLLALRQHNIKRLLAYSSIAHSGYIMLAFFAGDGWYGGLAAIFFYIISYGMATIGIFAILSLIERDGDEAQQISDLGGLAREHPGLAAAMAVCVFSLIGMPMTAGFMAKLCVLTPLVGETSAPQNILLLVIALVNAAIALGYYLRIVAACYLEQKAVGSVVRVTPQQSAGILVTALATILLGLAPSLLIEPLESIASEQSSPTVTAVIPPEQTGLSLAKADISDQCLVK